MIPSSCCCEQSPPPLSQTGDWIWRYPLLGVCVGSLAEMLKTVDCLVLRIDEQQRVDRGSVRAFEEAVAQLRQAYYRALARTGNRAYIRIELLAEAEESWRG